MMILRACGEPLELEGAILQNGNYNGMNFHRCILDNLNFKGSDMTAADFRSAKMNRANFISTTFFQSRLILVKAHNAFFDECSFDEALVLHSDFNGSSLKKADFSKCIVKNVSFSNCDIRGANLSCQGLETCDFEGAIYDDKTVWNETFNIIDCGGIKLG